MTNPAAWPAGDDAVAQLASNSAKDFANWATAVGSIIYFFVIMGAVAAQL